MGRQLPGERGVGRAVGFFGAFASQNRAGTQDCVSLPRKAWLVRNDLRATARGTRQDFAELAGGCIPLNYCSDMETLSSGASYAAAAISPSACPATDWAASGSSGSDT